MNLIVDQGNTATKIVLFNKDNLITERVRFSKEEVENVEAWIKKNTEPHVPVIISSVTNDHLNLPHDHILYLTADTPLPIRNDYHTPQTLGKDRLANAMGAWAKNKGGNSLCIDLGTCIKYDLITANGVYLGGNISPGLAMRYEALHQFTDKLPLIKIDPQLSYDFGTDTETSLQNGVQHGIFHEINGFIMRYNQEFDGLTIFMTGGDAKYFDKGFKNTIFAHADLTLIGLNEILNYNAKT